MQKRSVFAKRILWPISLLAGVVLLTFYFLFRITFINFSPAVVVFSILLFIAELHTIFHLYGAFYSLWPRKYIRYNKLNKAKNLRINMFICVCGEPAKVVEQTIKSAIQASNYYVNIVGSKYRPRVIVLNDGRVAKKDNWREIIALTKKYKVEHITRTVPGGFKAGNINNALKYTKGTDPFNTLDIVFDSDFCAKKNFLTEMTKPFADKSVDFAQSPQRYKNEKTWVAKAAAAHQIFFFDHICSAKGHDNALFLCGTNFAIRRSAFNAVGGMDTRFITEDYATSLELHLRGMKGVFIPKVIALGMAPTSLKQYFSQQQRWSKGSFDTTFHYLKRIVFGPMTIKQKFHYLLSATYYLIGLRDMILMLAPLPYLLFGVSLIKPNTWFYLGFIYAPLIIYNFILYLKLFRHPVKSLVLDIASFPVFVAAFFSSVLKKDLSFIVTIKKYEKENPFAVYKLQLMVAVLLGFGLFVGLQHPFGTGGALLNYFWATFDVSFLMLGFYLIIRENYNTKIIENKVVWIYRILVTILKAPAQIIPQTLYSLFLLMVASYILIKSPIVAIDAQQILKNTPFMTTQTEELLVPQDGIYYGYYFPELNSHPISAKTEIAEGEKASLAMFYQDWESSDSFDTRFMTDLYSSGHIPVVTWEPWNVSTQDIIDGKYDEAITKWARGAKSFNKPFFLRFAHEMNGNWYPWGNQNSPENYIAMWRHVHDIFATVGAKNVIWLWSPNNTDEYGNTDNLLSYYPGDEYVDWLGFSGFNWGSSNPRTRWTSFTEIATDTYNKLKEINKPIMVTETSSVSKGGNKSEWFIQTITSGLSEFPKIKAVVFFNQNINAADFSLDSLKDFREIVQKEMVNNSFYLNSPLIKSN